jgi:hypothetical protein
LNFSKSGNNHLRLSLELVGILISLFLTNCLLQFSHFFYFLEFLKMRMPKVFSDSTVEVIALSMYFLRIFCTIMLKLRSPPPRCPDASSLKKLFILEVDSSESFLMMDRNSSNSIYPEPSSSTMSIISCTCCLVSASPRPIKGSSSSSIPIAPEPSESKDWKHSLRLFISKS